MQAQRTSQGRLTRSPRRGVRRTHQRGFSRWLSRLGAGLRTIGRHRFTVMVVPHSERRVFNIQLNSFVVAFLLAILLGMAGGFVYLASSYAGSSQLVSDTTTDLDRTQASLDELLVEIDELVRIAGLFEGSLSDTLNRLDLNAPTGQLEQTVSVGDLSDVANLQQVRDGQPGEVQDLQQVRSNLEQAINPISEIGRLLETQEDLLTSIPTYWPVGGRSLVTMEFGPNVHPIRGGWYMHRGIDIWGPLGTPILAAANGRVVDTGFDQISGYGFYVIIDHAFGFTTRYSHLSRILVEKGEEVVQGQRIGSLGSTGFSTGPHLDFVLTLGDQVIDPTRFLKVRNSFARISRNR